MIYNFTISKKIYEILESDAEYFEVDFTRRKHKKFYNNFTFNRGEITTNKMYTKIIDYYLKNDHEKLIPKEDDSEKRVPISINYNTDSYIDAEIISKIKGAFELYVKEPRYEREKIVFYDIFKTIIAYIKDGEKMLIKDKYNPNEEIEILPRFFRENKEETAIYLVAYILKIKKFKTFKLSRIKPLLEQLVKKENFNCKKEDETIESKVKIEDELRLEQKIKKNFDPFLNVTNKMVVKFTKKGIKKYNEKLINRPIETKDSKNGNIKEYYITGREKFLDLKYKNLKTKKAIINIANEKVDLKETKESKEGLIKEFYMIPFLANIYFAAFFENAVIMDLEYMKDISYKLKKSIENLKR